MNPTRQRSSWVVALLSIGMGIAFTAGGGWMLARYFACPDVEASTFRVEEHDGRYIRLLATEAYEVGFQVEYQLSDPGSEHDPANRVARLVAIPVGGRVLIASVPLDHQGRSFTGAVKGLTSDIEMGLAEDSLQSSFRDLHRRLDSLRTLSDSARVPGFAPTAGPESTAESLPRTPTLRDLALPVYLDTREDERLPAALVIAVGLAFAGGGVAGLLRSHNSSTTSVAPDTAPATLDRQPANFEGAAPAGPSSGRVDFESHDASDTPGAIKLQCPQGHAFEVDVMYRGAARKCPECGAKVDVPAE